MKRVSLSFCLLLLPLALTGCSDAAETLGLGRHAPDEFSVVDRAPLSMPPSFALRPPKPGAPRPQETAVTQSAAQTLFGETSSDTESSSTENALLAAAGASKANPDIRGLIDQEAAEKVSGSPYLVERLLWWHNPNYGKTTVDADGEAARLRKAREEGENADASATPIIEKNKQGWLGL